MTDEHGPGAAGDGRFVWHPVYGGKSVAEAGSEIRAEIASDQRQYALALEGAEGHENSALRSVIELDRKWSDYDMGWAEADPGELAARVLAFEQERERRQQMIPFADYREAHRPPASAVPSGSVVDRLLGLFRGRGD